MEAILNSAIMNLAISESAILVFPLKHTHTCQDWFPPFAPSLTLPSLPFEHFTHSFWLNSDGGHLEFGLLEILIHFLHHHSHLYFSPRFTQKYSPTIWTKKTFTHSFWLNMMMVAILNSGLFGFSFWHLGFRHLVICIIRLTQRHSPCTLTLTQTNTFWFHRMMAAILNSVTLEFWLILDSAILVFPLKHTHTCQDWFRPFAQKTSLTLPSPIFAQENFTHSFWLNLMMVAILNFAILNSAILDSTLHYGIKTPCFLLADSLKNISLYSDSDSN